MFVATYKLNATTNVGLRPRMSAASPNKVGATVATAMYEVMVKLIWPMETDNDSASSFKAGKYMKLLKVEKAAAYATIAVMHRFSICVNTEYLSCIGSDRGLSSAFSESILVALGSVRRRAGVGFDDGLTKMPLVKRRPTYLGK